MAQPYRLSVYATRGTELILDQEFRAKAKAFIAFQSAAAAHIQDRDVCVLLSFATGPSTATTLAAKNTDAVHVELCQSFYTAGRG